MNSTTARVRFCTTVVLLILLAIPVMAGQASITIKPGTLQDALDAYAQATRTKIVYLNELIEGKNSPGTQNASPGDALQQILQGTGLTFQIADNNTAVLKKKKPTEKQPIAKKKEIVKSGTETKEEQDKVYMKIGEVTVTSKKYLASADAPASVDVIGSSEIEMENVDSSMELLKKVPGAYFGDWNQGALTSSFSLRGYDINSSAPVSLSIDGIPAYYSSRNMIDMGPIFPLEIDQIEMLKGAYDPRYGINNIAGSVNVYTKRGGDYTKARLLTGSYETYDGQIAVGVEEDNFSQNYFAGARSSDGYRDHSETEKQSFSGKWFYSLDDHKGEIGAIVRFFNITGDAPGYLSREDADNNPTSAAAYARSDGSEQENKQASLHFDYAFTDSLYWSMKTYAQQMEWDKFSRWSLSGTQSKTLITEKQYGAVSTLTFEKYYQAIKRLKIDWGVDYQYSDAREQRWTTEDRIRQGSEYRYFDYDMQYWGTFAQVDSDIRHWLRMFAALRVDSFDGNCTSKITNNDAEMLDLDFIWQPKVGTVITPFQGYNLYANWGRTFQLPAVPYRYGQDTSGNLISRDLTESTNDGWEAGIKASPFDWLSLRVNVWQMVASNEVRKKGDGSGDRINVGKTTRDGWDISFSVRPHPWVSMWGSYSQVEAVYTDPGETLAALKGKDIELIPKETGKLGVDFNHSTGISSSFWLEHQGDYYVLDDATNENETVGDYTIFNFKLAYTLGQLNKKFKGTTIGFEVKNLFDENYYTYVWNLDDGFQPGDARSFYAWMSVDL